MKHWYAIYTHVQQEVWAYNNLRERGLEVYLPRYLKTRRHARKMDTVKTPLFPRYLFARADIGAGERPAMAYAQGVSYVVGFGGSLASVRDEIIDEIRAREDETGLIVMGDGPGFKPGQRVRVRQGALCDQIGLFQCTADDQRVFFLLDLMGRQVKARVESHMLVAD